MNNQKHPLLLPTIITPTDEAIVGPASQRFGRRSYLPDLPGSIWQIQQGIVRSLSWQADGNTVTFGLWRRGDLVGRCLSRLDPYYIECLTVVEAIPLPASQWQNHPQILLAHLEQLEALTFIRSHRQVEAMLVSLLQWLGNKFGRVAPAGCLIDLRLTHQDIADLLNTTRVTITRLLHKLEAQGSIERLSIRRILLKETDYWYYQI